MGKTAIFGIMKHTLLLWMTCLSLTLQAQESLKLGLVKYNGGGDWYANLETSLPNLIAFCNDQIGTNLSEQEIVELSDQRLYQYPYLHLTGHGNIVLSDAEVQNLRKYLIAGGFLHIDDNYGMDAYVRTQLERVFPELELTELPVSHPIFHQKFDFDGGLPKIHAHDDERPQALGLIYNGRLVCLYTFESDLGDGWEDPRIHNDTQENHTEALKMGANIIQYVFMSNDGV